jgi:polysaccharide deacetylase 2 family uncharacterized protein YibQ
MKALFYTATAVFIALAGVIAYFALQSPAAMSGARVVLDIDVSGMPVVDGGGGPKASLDPYAGEEDKPGDATQEGTPASGQSGSDSAQPQTAIVQERPHAPEGNDARPARNTPSAEGGHIPAPPPGTALAGLNQDRPLFREVAPDAAGEGAVAHPEDALPLVQTGGEPADTDRADQTIAEPHSLLSSIPAPAALAADQDRLRGPADLDVPPPAGAVAPEVVGAAPAQAAAEVQAVIPPSSPPPVPARRPTDIPLAGERVATADGGVQFATTDVNPPRPPARVALLLRGVGRGDQNSDAAIASLPSAVSLGLWPYASDGQQLASRARDKGHEIIVQVPLEPTDPAVSPGPDTLLTTLPPEQNAQRLDEVLKRFDGYTGVTNLMGGKMLRAKASLKPLLEDLKARGLVYIGESNNSHITARQLARELNLRFAAAEVIIDVQPSPPAINKALARLVEIARKHGSAIGIGNATPATVQQVQQWSETLAAQGVTLVPVGVLTQTPGSS